MEQMEPARKIVGAEIWRQHTLTQSWGVKVPQGRTDAAKSASEERSVHGEICEEGGY